MTNEEKIKSTGRKTRELIPLINAAIAKLVAISADAAKLEYQDNDQASRRFKRGIVELENIEISALKTASKGIREEIRSR